MARGAETGRHRFDQNAYMIPAAFAEALARLQPGASLAFAAGEPLNDFHPTVKLAYAARDRGEVTLHKGGRDDQGRLLQKVQRVNPEARADDAGRAARDALWLDTPEGRVFLAIEQAAEAGLTCPSNAELAEAAQLRDADAASYRLRKLEDAGRVRVRHGAGGRVVSIIGSTLETAPWA